MGPHKDNFFRNWNSFWEITTESRNFTSVAELISQSWIAPSLQCGSIYCILKQWIVLNARADWLVKLRISCAIYLRATREEWRPGEKWKVKKSSKLIFCGVYYLTVLLYTKNNYSRQCRWLALDIYLAASRLGKYLPLATSTSVKSC